MFQVAFIADQAADSTSTFQCPSAFVQLVVQLSHRTLHILFDTGTV